MPKTSLPNARILIVDDEETNVMLLEAILQREGYTNFKSTRDPRQVIDLFREVDPDLILLDLMMPEMSGFEVMEQIQPLVPPESFLPILILTADATAGAKRQALSGHATDFLTKPFDNSEVALRIRNLLHLRRLHCELASHKEHLEELVRERTRELRQALVQLQTAQEHLVQQERLSAFGTMASGVAHDFNNVLSIVLGFGELVLADLHQHPELRENAEAMRTIITAARDGARMVTRLREFYRPSGEDPWELVDLAELAGQAITLTEPKWKAQAHQRGISITAGAEIAPVQPVCGHAAELREVLTNLIFNAVDAMPKGGEIVVRVCDLGEEIALEVADTGIGMTEEVRRRCLEPFFTTKGEEGTGLGLAMVYGIVQRHRGTLKIESEPGRGTNFCLRFPAQPPPAQAGATADIRLARPLTILVVDDDPFIGEILTQLLAHDCHVAQSVTSGNEALERIRDACFDLMITDQAMPGMTGRDLASSVKTISPRTGVILLTGFGAEEQPTENGEIDLVVGKPVTQEALRLAIAKVAA